MNFMTLTSAVDNGEIFIRIVDISMISLPTSEMLEAYPNARSQISLGGFIGAAIGLIETPEQVLKKLEEVNFR